MIPSHACTIFLRPFIRTLPGRKKQRRSRPQRTRCKGQSSGLAHVFIAGAHQLAIPARLTCGYCLANEAAGSIPALHCWAEAHIARLGWVGFDPTAGHCSDYNYVRLACGLDAGGTMPIRAGAKGAETLRVEKVGIVRLSS
jgi:transglutaminase-like putative cysteine protease